MNIFFLLILLLSLLNCSGDTDTFTVENVNGVKHIINSAPAWGKDPKIELEFMKKIGNLTGNDQNYQFFNPSDVSVDKEGNIYVLDGGNFRIQKFDPYGKYISTIGSKGQGPGEFRMPGSMVLDNNGRILVRDNFRINVFNQSGKFEKAINSDSRPSKFMAMKSNRLAIAPFIIPRKNAKEQSNLVRIISEDGKLFKEFGKRKLYSDMQMNIAGNSYAFATDSDDNIYVAFQMQNRIEKYSKEGRLLLEIGTLLDFTETEKMEVKPTVNSSGERTMVLMKNDFFFGIQIDRSKRIWVSTLIRQATEDELANRQLNVLHVNSDGKEENTVIQKSKDPAYNIYKLDIYAENGSLLGSVQIPELNDRTKFRIFGDRLFIIDKEETMAVYEYKIV